MQNGSGKSVLVIDDEEHIRSSIRNFLEDYDYEVTEAENGAIGVAKFAQRTPDIVLVDLRMPEMDGLEVLEHIRSKSPDTPLLVISGTGVIGDVIEALRNGAWDYLEKPIEDMSILLHAVKTSLERKKLIEDNRNYQKNLEKLVEERTAELQTEVAERKMSEERFRQMAENINEVFSLVEIDNFSMLYISPVCTSMYGLTPEEIYQDPESFVRLIHPDDAQKVSLLNPDLLFTKILNEEFRIVRKDGEVRWLNVKSFPIPDKQGKPFRAANIVEDITEMKNATERTKVQQQQLIQADKLASIGLMVSGVAHEINNPNNLIMLNADVIKSIYKHLIPILSAYGNQNPDIKIANLTMKTAVEKLKEMLSGISSGSSRIEKIVYNLKDFARRDTGELTDQVSIEQLIESANSIVHNLVKKSTDHFTVKQGKNIPKFRGNFQKLEQVIINLLTNACQALKDKSNDSITVKTAFSRKKEHIKIEIIDTGSGIPPELINRVMDPFFTTKQDYGGTGLGLSVSYGIIQEHGGTLEFDSQIGEGTTARVIIPVRSE